MSDRVYAKAQAQQKTLIESSPKNSLLQRTCACGQHTIAGGECSTCRNALSTLFRPPRVFEPPSASGTAQSNSPTQENASSLNTAFDRASRFGHDFSRIPVYPSQSPVLQTKLTVNQLGDVYEQEADRVAEQVMRMPDIAPSLPGDENEVTTSLMRKQSSQAENHAGTDAYSAPPSVHNVLNSDGGQPLDATIRAFMEPRFGHDFSQVRVHTNAKAAESASAINALAYTVGRDVVFGEGHYAPHSQAGRKLLAHELVHVTQQMTGPRFLARQTVEQYETKGVKLDPASLTSFWAIKIKSVFGFATTAPTKARLQADKEEQDAVLSVVWQMQPSTPITQDITNVVTIPKRTATRTSKDLVYQITFRRRTSPEKKDIVDVDFVTEGAGATLVALASPSPSFTPSSHSYSYNGFPQNNNAPQYWQLHREEERRVFNWIETKAPSPSFDQIITTTVTSGSTTQSASFWVKGTKNLQGQVSNLFIIFLDAVTPSTKTPPADYASHGSEDPVKGDKLGIIDGLDALKPNERLLVKDAIWEYFISGTRNAEVDAIVPIDVTLAQPKRVLYTFRFKPSATVPHTNDVDVRRIGEEGKEVNLAPQDTIALSRVKGFSEHKKDGKGNDDVKLLTTWLKTRYPGVTPIGDTVPVVEQDVTAKIRAGSDDRDWYKANYDITVLEKTKAKAWLEKNVTKDPKELADLKDFTKTELPVLELVLETMSDQIVKTFKGLRLIRQRIYNEWIKATRGNPGHFEEKPLTAGVTIQGTERTTIIFDQASVNADLLFLGGGPGTDGKPAVEIATAETYAHELGHTIEKRPKVRAAFERLVTKKSIKPITWYAASNPPKELFSESFALYHSDPEWLHQNWPDLYNFFDILGKTGKPP